MSNWIKRHKAWLVIVLALAFMAADAPERFRADCSNGMYNPTQSDSVNETYEARGFFVEAAGDVKITTADGSVITMTLLAGQQVSTRVTRFWDTGTSLTDAQINAYKD